MTDMQALIDFRRLRAQAINVARFTKKDDPQIKALQETLNARSKESLAARTALNESMKKVIEAKQALENALEQTIPEPLRSVNAPKVERPQRRPPHVAPNR